MAEDWYKDDPDRLILDRLVARWVLAGQPNKDNPETQAWLRENGYGHFIDKPAE